MQPEMILKSDVLDILFENRNKAYGAYVLRKNYNDRIYQALLITLSCAALVLFLSQLNFKEQVKQTPIAIFDPTVLQPPKAPEKKKEEPKKKNSDVIKRTSQAVATAKLTKPLVVPNDKADVNIPKISDLDNKIISTSTASGIDNPGIINTQVKDTLQGNGGGKDLVDNALPTSNPDIMPQYPGGNEALSRFLQKNLRPQNDMAEEEVKVNVRFVVGFDGTISGFTVVKSGGEQFDEEVLRVLKKMPHWVPGKSNGKNVAVYYMVPVTFVTEQ
ncbi:TonB family protein [Ferruginibacter albus]|uniref:TonB family protein n=1 Tax=Ferruginibacter albus TaxID=2875540 RepID=UPI001CC76BF6|nr:TonB family protein [Ferruginibacter albus]UAY51589.1 TonB family protein [Ferruginibacter albus]